jgi:hypothetical protein
VISIYWTLWVLAWGALELGRSGFKYQLCYSWLCGLWAMHLLSLSFSVLIC